METEVRQEVGGWRLRSDRKMGDTDQGQTGRWGVETEGRQEVEGWGLREDRKLGDRDSGKVRLS